MNAAMTRALPVALAASALLALPATGVAGKAPLPPPPSDPPSNFKGVPGHGTKAARRDRRAPVVTKVRPRRARVGELLTVTGKNFVRGRGKNVVFFYTTKGGTTFTRAE